MAKRPLVRLPFGVGLLLVCGPGLGEDRCSQRRWEHSMDIGYRSEQGGQRGESEVSPDVLGEMGGFVSARYVPKDGYDAILVVVAVLIIRMAAMTGWDLDRHRAAKAWISHWVRRPNVRPRVYSRCQYCCS